MWGSDHHDDYMEHERNRRFDDMMRQRYDDPWEDLIVLAFGILIGFAILLAIASGLDSWLGWNLTGWLWSMVDKIFE